MQLLLLPHPPLPPPKKSFGIDLPNTIHFSSSSGNVTNSCRTWLHCAQLCLVSICWRHPPLLSSGTGIASNWITESWIWNCFKSVPPEKWWCLVTVTNLYWIRSWFHFGNPDELRVSALRFQFQVPKGFAEKFQGDSPDLLRNFVRQCLSPGEFSLDFRSNVFRSTSSNPPARKR